MFCYCVYAGQLTVLPGPGTDHLRWAPPAPWSLLEDEFITCCVSFLYKLMDVNIRASLLRLRYKAGKRWLRCFLPCSTFTLLVPASPSPPFFKYLWRKSLRPLFSSSLLLFSFLFWAPDLCWLDIFSVLNVKSNDQWWLISGQTIFVLGVGGVLDHYFKDY